MRLPFTIPPDAALNTSIAADSLPEGPTRELMLAVARELAAGLHVRIETTTPEEP